jgi:hypothetical protein
MPSLDTAAFRQRYLPEPDAGMIEFPGAPAAPREARPPSWPGWLGRALIGGGIALLPWLVVLATSLPATTRVSHWSTAWVGLDAFEALGLVATGWLLRRGDLGCCLAAAATAVLLVVDAWFDMTTAAPGSGLATATAMAACAELPMAALCAVLAIRSLPGRPPDPACSPASSPPDQPEET